MKFLAPASQYGPITICTNVTRPSNPIKGQYIYETNTDKLLVYTTATTGWVPPWNLPWGWMSTGVLGADTVVPNSPTETTLFGPLTVTPIVANRYMTITVSCTIINFSGTATDTWLTLYRNSTSLGNICRTTVSGNAPWVADMTSVYFENSLAAGSSYTYTVKCTRNGGAASTVLAGCKLIAQDIGPIGNPV